MVLCMANYFRRNLDTDFILFFNDRSHVIHVLIFTVENKCESTDNHIDQLGYSNLTKILDSRLRNTAALNICWESFTILVVLLDSNMD